MKTQLIVFWGESIIGLIKPLIVLYFINKYYDISVYSEIVLINLILSISNNILNLKIPSYLVKFFNQNIGFENFINNLNSLLLKFGLALFLIGGLVIYFFNLNYSYLFIDLIIIISILLTPLKGIMIVSKKLNQLGLLMMGSKILFIILFLLSLVQKTVEFFETYLVLLFIENLTLFILLFLRCNSIIKFRFQKTQFHLLSDFFKYLFSFFGLNFLKSILKEIDRLIVAFSFDKEVLGMYDIAKKLFLPLKIFVSPFNLIFLKSTSKTLLLKKNTQYLKGKILKSEFFLILFFIVNLLGLIICYEFLKININLNLLSLISICFIGVIVFLDSILWWPQIITTQISRNFAFINLILKIFLTLTILPLFIYFFELKGLIISMILEKIISYSFWRGYVLNSKKLISFINTIQV